MDKSVLAFGPFIGSFEQEVLTFRPHMRWIENQIGMSNVFYSSHANRRFLYSHISSKKFIPVYGQLTRHELGQEGYCHKDVDQKDYTTLIRDFKDSIVEKSNCIKKNIEHQSLPYVKYASPISIYHKIFEPIDVPMKKRKGWVVFIPDFSMRRSHAEIIRNHLNGNVKYSVIGDMKCHLHDENEVLQEIDYFQTGYMKMVTAISNARAVICPCSHWTAIANLQRVPVLSWGENVGQYRTDGIYNFGNKESRTVYFDSETNINNLLKQIDTFLEGKV